MLNKTFPFFHAIKVGTLTDGERDVALWLERSLSVQSFMVWTHEAISRSSQCSTTGVSCLWNGNRNIYIFFNDALNTFYLRLYGVTHMVKDHTDSERGNPLPPH